MRAVPCLLLVFCTSAVSADDPSIPANITADARKEAITALTKQAARRPMYLKLEKETVAKIAATKKGAARAELEDALKFYRQELKALNAVTTAEGFAQTLSLTRVGEVGKFPHPKALVLGVLNKSQGALATETSRPADFAEPLFRSERVKVLVSGVDTSKWADDLTVPAPEGLFIVSTHKHRGATYLHLIRLELTKDEADAIMKAAKP